jgi:hypothetical protein
MAKVKYVAARQVAIGSGEPNPNRPGYELIHVYEPGDEVPKAEKFPNLAGLLANGYLAALDAKGEDITVERAVELIVENEPDIAEALAARGVVE